jgi:phosphoglycerate dehydrogenase-like enzyme
MIAPEIVIFSAKGRASLSESQQQAIEAIAPVTYISNLTPLSDDRLVELCHSANYIGLTRRTCTDFHAGIIRRLPHLQGLSVYATGTEWLDLAALQAHNIALRFLPDYSCTTVAEHAIGLLLTFSRRIHLSDRKAAAEIPQTVSLRGWELSGKKIGIVGLGRIGSRIAHLARAFGMEVSYCDPNIEAHPEFKAISFSALIQQSDIVMLAASLNRENPVMITAEVLQATAIRSGRVAGYGVDDNVFPLNELQSVELGRILQTGHTGWYSDEAMERGTAMWINNLVELARCPAIAL